MKLKTVGLMVNDVKLYKMISLCHPLMYCVRLHLPRNIQRRVVTDNIEEGMNFTFEKFKEIILFYKLAINRCRIIQI